MDSGPVKSVNESLVKNGPLEKIFYFEEIDSTNKYAKQYLNENPNADNTLILTSFQSNGIGRFNRKWFSSPGENLTFTLIKKFDLAVDKVHKVNFYSSYILYLTLKEIFKNDPEMEFELKWPNDMLLNGFKISGFLMEVKDINKALKTFIIGCGININQSLFDESISDRSSSLKNISKKDTEPEFILLKYINNFYSNFELLNNDESLIGKWKSGTNLIGKEINFKKYNDDVPESAVVNDIDSDGALCLRDEVGTVKKYYSGEITLSVK